MAKVLIVITAHNEGDLLNKAIDCVESNVVRAPEGFEIEQLVALDNPDHATLEVAKARTRFEILDFGDVGAVRNHAMLTKMGEFNYIVFLDADDSWSDNWLSNALMLAESTGGPLIVSPMYRIHLREGRSKDYRRLRFYQPTIKCGSFGIGSILLQLTNLWGSTFLINEAAASKLSFRLESDGFLFEDWWFFLDANRSLVPHLTAQGSQIYLQRHKSRLRLQSKLRKSGKGSFYQAPSLGMMPEWVRRPISLVLLIVVWRPFEFKW